MQLSSFQGGPTSSWSRSNGSASLLFERCVIYIFHTWSGNIGGCCYWLLLLLFSRGIFSLTLSGLCRREIGQLSSGAQKGHQMAFGFAAIRVTTSSDWCLQGSLQVPVHAPFRKERKGRFSGTLNFVCGALPSLNFWSHCVNLFSVTLFFLAFENTQSL